MKTLSPAPLLKWLRSQVGYHEGRDANGHWNNEEKYADIAGLPWVSDGGYPWCATFVYAGAVEAGMPALFPKTASTDYGAGWFKDAGRWSEYPSVGAQVFYGSHGDMVHTGVVIDYDANTITTIEGNTNTNGSAEGDGVYVKHRARRDDFVQGYGHPKYTAGVRAVEDKYNLPGTGPDAPEPPHTPDTNTRIDDLRDDLTAIMNRARKHGNDKRADKIKAALDALPKH